MSETQPGDSPDFLKGAGSVHVWKPPRLFNVSGNNKASYYIVSEYFETIHSAEKIKLNKTCLFK